jgi:hypothetical protein
MAEMILPAKPMPTIDPRYLALSQFAEMHGHSIAAFQTYRGARQAMLTMFNMNLQSARRQSDTQSAEMWLGIIEAFEEEFPA